MALEEIGKFADDEWNIGLWSECQELKLESNVEFMSVVSSTVSILLAFDIFVLPSLSEGFGISLMEAQVTGLPVIASCVGGIPDFVKQGETGILVPP